MLNHPLRHKASSLYSLLNNHYLQERIHTTLLKDYFIRNHAYRTGQFEYGEKALIYPPIIIALDNETRENEISALQRDSLEFLDTYSPEDYNILDIEAENSDHVYLSEITRPLEYEFLFYNGHGMPNYMDYNMRTDQIDPTSIDILDMNMNFFFAQFASCSVGRFISQDYIM